MLTLRVWTKSSICSMGTVSRSLSSKSRDMFSLLFHYAVLSSFGGVSVPPDLVRKMKAMSRMGLTGGHVSGYASTGESERWR